MGDLSQDATLLISFSFVLTILGFIYNINAVNVDGPKYLIHLEDDEGLLRSSLSGSRDFTLNVSVGCSGSVSAKAHLYVLVGGAQSNILTSSSKVSFSNFTEAFSESLYLSPEAYLMNIHFYIDGKHGTLSINYSSKNNVINLKETDNLRIVLVITGSEVSDLELVSFNVSESAWVSIWWHGS